MIPDLEPPYDELAERAVLGAIIADPDNMPTVLEYLREDDFYLETHRLLFSLLYKIWEDKGKDWDDIVLKEYIEKRGLKDKIDLSLIYSLVEEAATGSLLEEAIRNIKEKSGLRQLMDLSLNILKGIKQEPDFTNLLEFLKIVGRASLLELRNFWGILGFWSLKTKRLDDYLAGKKEGLKWQGP